MRSTLTPAECFDKYVVANERITIIKDIDPNGWYSIRCPARKHGKPLRVRIGDHCPIFYTDLGRCPEPEVFAGLVKLGIPGEYLKRPKGPRPRPAPEPERKPEPEADRKLADAILDIAFGEGTTTDRMVTMVIAALDGEMPEGPMVGVFANNLRVSERTLYRATAEARRRNRNWISSP